MSYFEEIKETNSVLKKIIILLKPLTMITGGGRNNLAVDIGTGNLNSVTTVSSVTTMQNQANMGTVNAFVIAKDQARNAYSNSIRNNITF